MSIRSTDKLLQQVRELESNISYSDALSDSVSKAPIGWHLEHIMLVINGVVGSLVNSDPQQFKRKFNFKKFTFFLLGKFPRGKVRAPKSVRPTEEIMENRLKDHLQKTKHQTSKLSSLHENAYFKHPFFGELDLNDSIRFLEMHTEHHLKIIRAISSASN